MNTNLPVSESSPQSTADQGSSGSLKYDLLPDSLLLLLITAGAYLGAYVYETSYVQVFGIPPECVEVGVSTLVSVGGWLLLTSCVIGQVVFILWDLDGEGFFKASNGIGRFLIKWWLFLLLNGLAIFLIKIPWYGWITISLWTIMMLSDLLVPYLEHKTCGSYNQRLAQWLNTPGKTKENAQANRSIFKGAQAIKYVYAILIIAFSAAICSFLGTVFAKTRNGFAFVDTEEENVIIRRYGERYVLVKYDWARHEFTKQFRLVEASALKNPIVWRQLPEWTVKVRANLPPPKATTDATTAATKGEIKSVK